MKFIRLKRNFDNTNVLINMQEITYCGADPLNENGTTIWLKNGGSVTVNLSVDEIFNLIKMEE